MYRDQLLVLLRRIVPDRAGLILYHRLLGGMRTMHSITVGLIEAGAFVAIQFMRLEGRTDVSGVAIINQGPGFLRGAGELCSANYRCQRLRSVCV